MRKILFVILFVFPTVLFGQNTILWKITNSENSHTSYLLGTYHLLDKTFVDSFPIISEKLKGCDIVLTEVEKDSSRIVNYYNKRESSDQINQILTPSDIDLIKKILIYSTVKDINKLTPGELFAKLSAYYDAFCLSPTDTKLRMDDYIQFLAKENNKQQIYFESDTLQIELLRKGTAQIDWNIFKKNIKLLLDKYKQPNPKISSNSIYGKYVTFNLNYSFDDKCGGEVLFEKRNDEWMTKISTLFKKDNCFMAVGLLHYFKRCGIIMQLRQLGFKVEPILMQ